MVGHRILGPLSAWVDPKPIIPPLARGWSLPSPPPPPLSSFPPHRPDLPRRVSLRRQSCLLTGVRSPPEPWHRLREDWTRTKVGVGEEVIVNIYASGVGNLVGQHRGRLRVPAVRAGDCFHGGR